MSMSVLKYKKTRLRRDFGDRNERRITCTYCHSGYNLFSRHQKAWAPSNICTCSVRGLCMADNLDRAIEMATYVFRHQIRPLALLRRNMCVGIEIDI